MRALRLLLAVFTVGALTLTFAACGGDDGGGSPLDAGSDGTTADANEDDTTDDTADDTADDTGDGTTDGTGDFCLNEDFMAAAAGVGADLDSGNPEDVKEFYEELADEVPDEIADDFTVFGEFYVKYAEAIAELGEGEPDMSDPEVREAFSILTDPEFAAASENISEWMDTNC